MQYVPAEIHVVFVIPNDLNAKQSAKPAKNPDIRNELENKPIPVPIIFVLNVLEGPAVRYFANEPVLSGQKPRGVRDPRKRTEQLPVSLSQIFPSTTAAEELYDPFETEYAVQNKFGGR